MNYMGMRVIECLPGTLIPVIRGGATEQRGDVGGVYYTTATVDPGNHTAITSVNTSVSIAGILATDLVVAIPPATLEASIAVQGVHTVVAGGFTLRTTNASAGAVDPASATWGFVVFRR